MQTSYRTQSLPGLPGQPFDATGNVVSGINKAPQAAQIESFDVDTSTLDEVYSVFIDGVEISITGSGVDTDDVEAFVDAINASLISGKVVAEVDSGSPDTAIITARHGGIGFVFALGANAAKMTKHAQTQANATADEIPFGAGVVLDGWSEGTGSELLVKLAKATNFTAQVDTLKLVYDASVDATVSVTYYDPATGDYATVSATHTQATDADTSVVALAGALNAVLPANTVDVTHPDADTLTLTAEVAGAAFRLSYGFGPGRDTGAWDHASNADVTTDVNRALLGIAQSTHVVDREAPKTPGALVEQANAYPANRAINIREKGRVWVLPEAQPSIGDRVYIRLAANGALDKLGGFTPTPGAGVVLLEAAKWHKVSGDRAVLAI